MRREYWTPGMRLERLIYDRGVSKEELANMAGVSRQTVYNLCNDMGSTMKTWEAIAAALGMELTVLIKEVME